jgi:hypothetical protein
MRRVFPAALLVVCVGIGPSTWAQQKPPAPPEPPQAPPQDPPPAPQPPFDTSSIVAQIERAHGAENWRTQKALSAELALEFSDGTGLEGTLTYDIQGRRVRFEVTDGPLLVFDGNRAWVAPADTEFPHARFNLRAWPYLLALPFTLRDTGVSVEPLGLKKFEHALCQAARVTFAPGSRDTPEDWYLLFLEPASSRVRAAAYIVTYGRSRDEAEKAARVVRYESYTRLDGAIVATHWSFFDWSVERSAAGAAPVGHATLRGARFVEPEDGAFDRPADAREDPPR